MGGPASWHVLCIARSAEHLQTQPILRFPRGLREEAGSEGRQPKRLVYVMPDEDLAAVVARLAAHKCSMAPILTGHPDGPEVGRGRAGSQWCRRWGSYSAYRGSWDATALVLSVRSVR